MSIFLCALPAIPKDAQLCILQWLRWGDCQVLLRIISITLLYADLQHTVSVVQPILKYCTRGVSHCLPETEITICEYKDIRLFEKKRANPHTRREQTSSINSTSTPFKFLNVCVYRQVITVCFLSFIPIEYRKSLTMVPYCFFERSEKTPFGYMNHKEEDKYYGSFNEGDIRST